jgi:hypothetical protein
MNCTVELRQLVSSAGLLVALTLSSCATAPPRADRYVAPPAGSTWVNARVDTGSYGSSSTQLPMTRGEQVWQGIRVITFETPENTLLASPSGDYIAQVKDDKILVSWEPPLNLDWPLRVGKTSKRSYRMTLHTANRTVSYELEQKVEAYESVTTPAGTFNVFRVTSSDTLGNENIDWISTELGIFVKRSLRRTVRHAQGPGTREMQIVSISIKQ